jgi:RNA polymerase sigma-70 factor, ECF subfamily
VSRDSEAVRASYEAVNRADVEEAMEALAPDAEWHESGVLPEPHVYRGRDAIAAFLTRYALQDRWRLLPARANGQLAFGCYAWDAEQRSYTGLSLDVLTLDGTRAREVTSFVTPYARGPARERFAADVLEHFGLPDRLD